MKMSRLVYIVLPSFFPMLLASCTHVRGVVLEGRTDIPVPGAQFTIGRPDMIVTERHAADIKGRFDFYISSIDESSLYVWDGKGDPTTGVLHIDHLAISDHMVIHMQNGNESIEP